MSDALRAPRRRISALDAFSLVVGSMIGSGIFLVPAESARLTGSGTGLLLAWGAAGALTVLAAISCAELAVRMPEAGGPYVFLARAWGPFAGFLYGWGLVTVVQSGTIAAVAVAFARYLGVLVPAVHGGAEKAVALAVVALLSAANARGVATGTAVQNGMTAGKVAALLLLTAGGLLLAVPHPAASALAPALPAAAAAVGTPSATTSSAGLPFVLAFAAAMAGPLFSQSAWTNLTFAGAEVREPGRTFPLALVGGCGFVAAAYVLANGAYLRLLGWDGVAHAPLDRVGSAAAGVLLPSAGPALMAAAILVSTFGCVNGLVLSGARLWGAMARGGWLPRGLGALNRHEVPGRALAAQGAWAAVLVLSGTYGQLLRYVVAAELVLSVFLVLALVRLRRAAPSVVPAFRAWGYPATPVVYAAGASALVVLLAAGSPKTAGTGLLLFALGLPVFLAVRRRRA